MDWLADPAIWISLLTLTLLEIVLGIDNIVFISILANKLPESQQHKARQIGLMAALGTRILLLLTLAWVAKLDSALFTIEPFWAMKDAHPVSGKDLVLFVGGLFLIAKSTKEIHEKLEGVDGEVSAKLVPTFSAVIVQIMLLDIVFSLDSVITAVGMVKQIGVMVAAVVIAMMFMLFFSKAISDFINERPTLKVLALSFLILIGFVLVAESFHVAIPKGYIYFAMAFSVGVEMVNLKMLARAKSKVALRQKYR
ncbi:MAG: putative tellurium resistance membrane protein TerC [Candidatus Binatia bacterium]|jgi:predicted tellurium resistance membrane protein TerC